MAQLAIYSNNKAADLKNVWQPRKLIAAGALLQLVSEARGNSLLVVFLFPMLQTVIHNVTV